MKTPFILLSLLFAELFCAQQPRIMLQTKSCDYFRIEGKSGEKFYDQVQTINDFDIELYYDIINDPKRDIRDWSITGVGKELCQYEVFLKLKRTHNHTPKKGMVVSLYYQNSKKIHVTSRANNNSFL